MLSDDSIRAAHAEARSELVATVRQVTGVSLDPNLPILGFARRMTGYKRPHLLFDDLDRLTAIARAQPFQVVFAGKAHPHDEGGKALIARIHEDIQRLRGSVSVAFLPGYDFLLAQKTHIRHGCVAEHTGAADKLEGVVLPMFHGDPAGWARVMKGAISKVGAVFTSHCMMRRYAAEAYLGRGG